MEKAVEEFKGRNLESKLISVYSNGNWKTYAEGKVTRSRDLVNWESATVAVVVYDREFDASVAAAGFDLSVLLQSIEDKDFKPEPLKEVKVNL